MNDLFLAALALDLRELAPEIARLASSGPEVEEGKFARSWGGGFTGPGNERSHLARHVTALWLEPDADTRARMWTAMVLVSPWEFIRQSNVAAALRDHYRSALAAASPALGEALKDTVRNAPHPAPHLLEASK